MKNYILSTKISMLCVYNDTYVFITTQGGVQPQKTQKTQN